MGIFGKNEEKTTPEAKEVVAEEKKVVTKKTAVVASAAAKAHGVIVAPVVTEKSHDLSQNGKYVFRVSADANKTSVKKAVTEMYDVSVEDVNIVCMPKKFRTVKRDRGYQKAYKKAIVTVKKGQHIGIFDVA